MNNRTVKTGLLVVDGRYAYAVGTADDASCQSAPAATVSVMGNIAADDDKPRKKATGATRVRRHKRGHASRRRLHDSDETRVTFIEATGEVIHIDNALIIGDNNEVHGNNNKAIGHNNTLIGVRCTARGRNNVVSGPFASAYGFGNRVTGKGATLVEYSRQSLSLSAHLPKTQFTPRWKQETGRQRSATTTTDTRPVAPAATDSDKLNLRDL